MFNKVNSGAILGIEGYMVSVEADVSDGLPAFVMVGYLAAEVKEAQDRVRTAIRNSGYRLPPKKITVNLSPADIRKDGTAFDLPVAIAVLASFGIVEPDILKKTFIVGELGLDGVIKSVRGALSLVSAAKENGMTMCFLPQENVLEGCVIAGISCVGVSQLSELVTLLNQPDDIVPEPYRYEEYMNSNGNAYDVDYADVHGQILLRRATEVAVAGRHNLMIIGPAGTGKSMISKRIPTIMPELSLEENLEISKIYSICGMLPPSSPLLSKRPFRSPHHTISPNALTGGGRVPKPGEISLASRGVLFLDELPEFQRNTIEILRQPLEDHKITVSRVHGTFDFPAYFMLVTALNPCPCGFYPDRNRCNCSEHQIQNYLKKISRPLLDRIDICVESMMVPYQELNSTEQGESSEQIRQRVERTRQIQRNRQPDKIYYFNGEMQENAVNQYCQITKEDEDWLRDVYERMGLSVRAHRKILKVARTIADLEGTEEIQHKHLCEAVGYRSLESKYWGGANV